MHWNEITRSVKLRKHGGPDLDTDAKSKCDKYMHLGMELAGTRDFGPYGKLYDLIEYPDSPK